MTITIDRPVRPMPLDGDSTRRGFLVGAAALTALLATSCAAATTPDGGATRPIDTDFGTVEVPTRPLRVVTTYTDTLDLAVALELPLVAAPGARGSADNPFPPFLPPEPLRGVQRLNTYPEQEFEAIAAARPDLILNSFTEVETHRGLSGIAPTVTIAPTDGVPSWQDILTRLGPAFGKEAVAERIVRERAELAASVRAAVAAGPFAGATYAAGYAGASEFTLYGATISPSPILVELGLRPVRSAPAAGAADSTQPVSPERLSDLADADVLLVTGAPVQGGYEPDPAAQGVRQAATWTGLPAVRAGAVIDIPVDLVFTGPCSDRALLTLLRDQLG